MQYTYSVKDQKWNHRPVDFTFCGSCICTLPLPLLMQGQP